MTDQDMLSGQTLVYFGPEPWEGMWRNRHQLMSRFARNNTVFYVEPAVWLKETLRNRIAGQPDAGPRHHLDPTGVNIVRRCERLPISGAPLVRHLAYWNYRRYLNRLVAAASETKPIVWVSRPYHQRLADMLDSALLVYHVVDEYTGYVNMTPHRKAMASRLEAQLLNSVDMAITVSASLQRDKARHNQQTYLVPNAVDFEAYKLAGRADSPEFLKSLSRPIIGYTGLVGARLDLGMIRETAMKRPNWSFVLLGDMNRDGCGEALNKLEMMNNVHFPGSQPSEQVPAWVAEFDACILPYTLDARARHASPLKLFEYAAAGKPIVSSDVPAAREFDFVKIINSSGDTIAALEEVLQWPSDHKQLEEGRRIARLNTWDHRVQQLSRILNAALAGQPLSPMTAEARP